MDTPPDIRALIEKTFSPVARERLDAIIGLKKAGRRAIPAIPFIVRLLDDSADTIGREAYHAIDEHRNDDFGEAAVAPLIAALGVEQYKGETRRVIVNLLARIEDRRAVPAMIAALEDEDPEVRWRAAQALVDMPDQRAFEPLMRCLRDKNDRVVSTAIWALGEIGDRRAVEPIIPFLTTRKREKDQAGVRDSAAEALGKLGDRRAFEPLLAVYQDKEWPSKEFPDWHLQKKALTALGRTKDPRAFEVLRRALEDEDTDVFERVATVWGLGGLGDDRSIALLKAILREERPTQVWWKIKADVPRVRPAAALALVSTGNDSAIDAVIDEYRASPEIREDSEESFKDLHFRTAVVDALAMSSNPRAYLKVIDILEGTDMSMRKEAAWVLHQGRTSPLLSPNDIPVFKKRKLPALNDVRVLQALMKVARSQCKPEQIGKRAMKTCRDTREFAIAVLRKSGNPVPVQRDLTTEKKDRDFPQNSGKNGLE